jgi:hypothetical protein
MTLTISRLGWQGASKVASVVSNAKYRIAPEFSFGTTAN